MCQIRTGGRCPCRRPRNDRCRLLRKRCLLRKREARSHQQPPLHQRRAFPLNLRHQGQRRLPRHYLQRLQLGIAILVAASKRPLQLTLTLQMRGHRYRRESWTPLRGTEQRLPRSVRRRRLRSVGPGLRRSRCRTSLSLRPRPLHQRRAMVLPEARRRLLAKIMSA